MTNLPHPAEHGAYTPGKGYYDKTVRRWVSKQSSLTAIADPLEVNGSHAASFAAWTKREEFAENPDMEQLITMRDSDRPEARAKAEQIITGRMRMQLDSYEKSKAEHLAATEGGQ